MSMTTKLIECGSTIYVYDYHSSKGKKTLGIEKGISGLVTNLERLLLTNFVSENLLVSFDLRIQFTVGKNLSEKILTLINHLKSLCGKP